MNPVFVELAFLSAVAAVAAPSAGLQVCLDDSYGVSVPARGEFVQELTRLIPHADFNHGCPDADAGVRIALLASDGSVPQDALGAIRVNAGGQVAPPVLVFVDTVESYSEAASEESLGRALARVAGHELLHYLRQSSQHGSHDLLRSRLSAHELTGVPGPARWTRRGRDINSGR